MFLALHLQSLLKSLHISHGSPGQDHSFSMGLAFVNVLLSGLS